MQRSKRQEDCRVREKYFDLILQLAMKLGYVRQMKNMFIPVQEVKKYPKREVAIITAETKESHSLH